MVRSLPLLVVDDKEIIRTTLSTVLEEHGYDVSTAANGAEALSIYQKERFPVVITDIYMPHMNGLDLLDAIKAIDPGTQVIMMTRYASIDSAIATLRAGAFDYLIKPFEGTAQIVAVVQRASRKIHTEQRTYQLIDALKQKANRLASANLQLQNLASCDGLTGLYNYRYFKESLSIELGRAKRYAHPFSLLFIDLDYFKIYNDTNGHPNGDKLLIDLARLFSNTFRETDIICRYGGDEFVVILPETSKQATRTIAAKLNEQVANFPFEGRQPLPGSRVTVSIGFATYPEDGQDSESLLQHADRVMYAAKKNRGLFAEPEKIYNALGTI